MTDHPIVWYASYGSNMLRARFMTYIEGGVPPGGSKFHRGARDQRPPLSDTRLSIPYRLFFARESSNWGPGGVAFLSRAPSEHACAVGRAYLLTLEQFEDVWSQENGWEQPRPFPLLDVVAKGALDVGEGWYDRALSLPARDGIPVLTFTGSMRRGEPPLKAPAPAYLAVVCQGLAETGLSVREIVEYLVDVPGIYGQMSRSEIEQAATLATGTATSEQH